MGPNTHQHPSANSSDNRYFPRWEVENRVLFQMEDSLATYEAKTKDLSCAGTCLIANSQPIQRNQKIKLIIYLSPAKFISLTGKIVWSKLLGNQHEVGINFENTNLKTQDTILEHAFEIRHNDVVRNWYKGWRS